MSKKKHDEDKPKKRTKEEQEAQAAFLKMKFAELAKGQELIPVVLDRATWEGIVWSISRALELKHKEKK